MSSETLLSNVIPFAGSGLFGYAMGFALKKILKWMLIIVSFLGWDVLWWCSTVAEVWLCEYQVNWNKLGNDTSTQIEHWAANVDISNAHSLFHTLGIFLLPAAWVWDSWQGL